MDVHFVNTLNVPLPINLWVNIDFAKPEEVQKLYTGARLQINSAIDVPPCARSTTCVTWIPTVPVNFFSLWMHSDKAIQSTIDVCNRVINGQCVDVGPRLYDNYDATDPTILRPTEPLRALRFRDIVIRFQRTLRDPGTFFLWRSFVSHRERRAGSCSCIV